MELSTTQILLYLVAAILFILGIRGLTHPRTAVRGNLTGALGMLVAVIVTLAYYDILHWGWVIIGLGIGGAIGAVLALKVRMTAMPELVGLFNGFGGGASFLVAGAVLHEALAAEGSQLAAHTGIATAASGLIGAVTLSGSLVAFIKLREKKWIENVVFPGQVLINAALALIVLVLAVVFVMGGDSTWLYWVIVLLALAMGVSLVTPIGGADMPVVIALLNSYSGLAAAATGFVIDNTLLIIAGSLVGASGLILTRIMCDAMNRSLTNVLFGVMAPAGSAPSADAVYGGRVKSATPDEVALLFDGAKRVAFVPGYGMAVAQAQHVVHDLSQLLESRGVEVEFHVHPVAGRMPGHMNVLLAEADVPYEQLRDLEQANSEMSRIDVAVVVGANDVVNPDARQNPDSPIAGMPIINVDFARTVVVVKRSLSPGFAGIPNPLFAADNCVMMFGDGRKALLDLLTALKSN